MCTAVLSNVVVVGGGIVGASIAWHLAPHTNVTIIAEEIGGTATPNSFAWVNAASTEEQFYYDFRHRSLERWREISHELRDLPIHWGGAINAYDSLEELVEDEKTLTTWGSNFSRVNTTEISYQEPKLSQSFLPNWGLSFPEDGALEAHTAAKQLIAHAVENNAKLKRARAEGFRKTNGRVDGVILSSGEVQVADHVIVAAGLGSVSLLESENITLPVTGKAGLLGNTKPTKQSLVKGVFNGLDLHVRQTLDGVLRFGTYFGGGDPGDDPEKTALDLFAKLQKSIVGGEKLDFDHFTIGHRPTPEDGLPILGPSGLDGLSIAVMHSGVTNAALVGELLSRQILTGETDPALNDFRLDRFD
ncbi:hypothetical protein FDECE_10620 [Fusarium decemcellulare]|nr:hypothetical protein FDECE_10620 [Fusarium decemcellulare]